MECPIGQFKMDLGNGTVCHICTHCERLQRVYKNCTQDADTVCLCPTGYIEGPLKSCRRCPKGMIASGNICVEEVLPPPNRTNVAAIIGYVSAVLFPVIFAIAIFWWIKKRRPKGPPAAVILRKRPDLVPLTPPPHLPDKKVDYDVELLVHSGDDRYLPMPKEFSRARPSLPHETREYGTQRLSHSDHQYLPAPSTPGHGDPLRFSSSDFPNRTKEHDWPDDDYVAMLPLPASVKATKVSCRVLPFAILQRLEDLLNAVYPKNYRHLAGVLGYSPAFVAILDKKSNPVEALLEDFITRDDASKERLYEALVRIGRADAATELWHC